MKTVAIIGSSKFKAHHLGAAQRETLLGNIVLITGFFHHVDMVPISDGQKLMIDSLCAEKVRRADEVFVVNLNGYIGETTRELISLAERLKKPVRYMEDLK